MTSHLFERQEYWQFNNFNDFTLDASISTTWSALDIPQSKIICWGLSGLTAFQESTGNVFQKLHMHSFWAYKKWRILSHFYDTLYGGCRNFSVIVVSLTMTSFKKTWVRALATRCRLRICLHLWQKILTSWQISRSSGTGSWGPRGSKYKCENIKVVK